jgi:hypothetical protein
MEKTKYPEAKTEYRNYTLTVVKARSKSGTKYDGKAIRGKDGNELVCIGQLSIDDALEGLKRNIDYWEGIQDIEFKTNKELARYITDEFLLNTQGDLTGSQSAFLLEVSDRLRRCACHDDPPHGD